MDKPLLSEWLNNFNKTDHEALVTAIEKVVIPEVAQLEAENERLREIEARAKDVIKDWPFTLYGDDDPGINHWVMLRKLADALKAGDDDEENE